MSIPSTQYKIEVGKFGRVTLPSKLRKAHDIKEGDLLTLYETDAGLRLQTSQEQLEEIHSLVSPYLQGVDSPVEDFLAFRRKEAEAEAEEIKRWEQ
ncbi:MAG: AbrB/MazE/SpoVT family DNA-binding domain-containing protein [Cyanobacteriota bacterium]|nr:AbrB/MazE/SpoVT family DNA-binding domain-containing protein [Cyanobacteriota bacterium]